MSRNLPWRVTSSTRVPSSACSGGSKVLSALNPATWTVVMARSRSRPCRSRASASTSGSSGTLAILGGDHDSRGLLAGDRVCREATTPGGWGGAQWGHARRQAAPADGVDLPRRRGSDRALRVSWHHESGVVVLSLWRENVCAGSFRLAVDEVPDHDRRAARRARRRLPARAHPPAGRCRGKQRGAAGRRRDGLTAPTRPTLSRASARQPDTVGSWTRSGTRTPPAPASVRPSSPAATSSWRRSTSCSSECPRAPGAVAGPDRAARGRQDGAAQRAAQCRRTPPLGHRQARGPSRPAAAPAAQRCPPPGGGELGHPEADEVDHVLGVIRSFAQREAGPGAKLRDEWPPASTRLPSRAAPTPVTSRSSCLELFTDLGGLAADVGKGISVHIDEMQDLGPTTCRRCAPRATR